MQKCRYCLLALVLITTWVFAQDRTENPLRKIPAESIGSVWWSAVDRTGLAFRAEFAVTNREIARRTFLKWQQAEVGNARYVYFGPGSDYVFIGTNGQPLVSLSFLNFMVPPASSPNAVTFTNQEIMIGQRLLPKGHFLLQTSRDNTNGSINLREFSQPINKSKNSGGRETNLRRPRLTRHSGRHAH